VLPVLNSGQTQLAFESACELKKAGRPVFIVGHSLGGRAALAVARKLVSECGFAPDHVFTLDPFEAPDVMAPPGVPVTNFHQRRSWWFQGPEVGDARANIFVPEAFHLTITEQPVVQRTIEQTIFEGRGIGESLGGRY
jgi:pimeloyl-ACP methyl ester carboxylesterase